MQINKPNTCLTHTSILIKLVFVISLFTLLRAAWLLHPSQVTKYSRALNNYHSTTSTNSTFSLTMVVTKTQQIKDKPSHDSHLFKHLKKKQNGTTGSAPTTLLTGGDLTQTATLVSPLGKSVVYLTGDDVEEMWQGVTTNVDLTDPGEVSNGLIGSLNELDNKEKDINMTGSKDGLNGSSNKLDNKLKNINMTGSKDGVNKSNKSQEVDLTDDPKTVSNGSSNLVENSKNGPDGLTSAKPANGEIGLFTKVEDKSKHVNMNGSNDGLGKVPASTKPANGGFNSTKQLDVQVNVIDMSGPEGAEDALSSTKSVSNQNDVLVK